MQMLRMRINRVGGRVTTTNDCNDLKYLVPAEPETTMRTMNHFLILE